MPTPLTSLVRLICLVTLAFSTGLTMAPFATAGGGLVAHEQAMRLGLTRAWFSQTQLDRSRHHVESAVLDGDQLFVLASSGTLHVMDANTGQTVWTTRLGNPEYPSLGPAVSDKHVAMVNGSTLFVVRRSDGQEELTQQLDGGAGGGPALTEQHVYVPHFSGKMEAHSLTDERAQTWYYASTGRVFDAPTSTPDSVMWPTDRGYLYVANPMGNGVRYRFEATGQIAAHPAVGDGVIYASSASGYVHAIREKTGAPIWRYSTGEVTTRSPAVFGNRVYVTTEGPTLHALSTDSGDLVWRAPNVEQLVGASKSRVYGLDRQGVLTILDKASGVQQGRLSTSGSTSAIRNDKTDRLYLISDTGLVQCLHEIDSAEPFVHGEQPAEEEPDEMAPAEEKPAEQPADEPADDANPFGPGDDDDPFGGGDDDNPFEF